MTESIPITEWETMIDELRRFGDSGEVSTEGDRILIDFGSAYLEVSSEGHVRTGMALHEFEHDDVIGITVDHTAGSITIDAEAVNYTFRRPGR